MDLAKLLWKLLLLGMTIIFYITVWMTTQISVEESAKKPATDWDSFVGDMKVISLFLVAWLFAVSPAVDHLLGKQVQFDIWDMKRHAINLAVLSIGAYANNSPVLELVGLAKKSEASALDLFTVITGVILILTAYAFTEMLVPVIVTGKPVFADSG